MAQTFETIQSCEHGSFKQGNDNGMYTLKWYGLRVGFTDFDIHYIDEEIRYTFLYDITGTSHIIVQILSEDICDELALAIKREFKYKDA